MCTLLSIISSTVENEFRLLQFGHFSLSRYGIPPSIEDISIVIKLKPIARRIRKINMLPSWAINLPMRASKIRMMMALTSILVDFFIVIA